jgi:hypothetical protein
MPAINPPGQRSEFPHDMQSLLQFMTDFKEKAFEKSTGPQGFPKHRQGLTNPKKLDNERKLLNEERKRQERVEQGLVPVTKKHKGSTK